MTDLTFNEHIAAALAIAQEKKSESTACSRGEQALTLSPETRAEHDAAARDLALTITHLEDANTRYNSARYHQKLVWQRTDPDK